MSKQNKKIEIKNYIILGLIVLITVIAVFYARNFYLMNQEYYENNSVMLEVVKEVKQDELSNYLIENPKFVLYVAPGQKNEIKGFEKNFKTIVNKEKLQDIVLYLNTDKVDMTKLKQDLQQIATTNIKEKINQDNVATIYIIENGKIIDIITNPQNKSKTELKQILKKYGVIDND